MLKIVLFFFLFISLSLQSQIITLTTTSKSAVWSPIKVIKLGQPLTWKASATGMTDQIDITNGPPMFDLSLSRTSPVTITATSSDGSSSFTELGINSLNLTSLITANAVYLTSLSCTDNQLRNLDVVNNINLIELFCHTNQLTKLDITKNTALTNLACFFNSISNLDLSQNTELSKISISNNLLRDLDLSLNSKLTSLECDSNRLENLNVQNGTNTIIDILKTTSNINLFCIQVDNVDYSNLNWRDIDSWTSFNKDCTFTNETPIANDDEYETLENTTITIDAIGVLLNDIDPDDDPLFAILETNVNHGNVELNADGGFIYTPELNFYGTDSFTYKATDGELDSNVATVTIDVILVNEAPIANDNSYETSENIALDIHEDKGVLSNDLDPDRDPLTAVLLSDVGDGFLVLESDGSFTYRPNQDYYGTDSFSYRAYDGIAYSNEASVFIDIKAISDIIMPNAFTPNNDNINDYFKPEVKGMKNVIMAIYDTWGNLIYSEEGSELIGWDGNIKGQNAENGNYLYIIAAFPMNDEKVELKGLFTLIK